MLYSHQSDSLDHVLDMTADSADCGQLLSVAPPFIYTKLRKTAVVQHYFQTVQELNHVFNKLADFFFTLEIKKHNMKCRPHCKYKFLISCVPQL